MKNDRRILATVLAFLALSTLPAAAGNLRVGSLASSRVGSWTLDGGSMLDARAKLTNLSNFGASAGVDARPIVITDTAGPLDAALLAGFDVFFVGYVADGSAGALTNAELTALQTWVNGGGTLVAACDAQGYDNTCTFFGHPADTPATNPMTPALPDSLFLRPFGQVASFTGDGAYSSFSVTAGATVLAQDSQARAVILRKEAGSGRVFLLGDVNFLASGTSGPSVTNGNDRLLANLFSWAAGPLRVGSIANSRFGTGYTLDGGQMSGKARAKLLNTKLFGYDGTHPRPIRILDTPSTLTAALLDPLDVFFIGYLADANANAFTAPELAALQAWVNAGGVLLATCDSTSYDAVCSSFGYVPGTGGSNPMTPTVASHPSFAGPFGALASFLGQGTTSSFNSSTGAFVLANDSAARPVMLSRASGSGLAIFMSDVDFFSDRASAGDAVTNDNDTLVTNTFAFAGGCCRPGDLNGDGVVDIFDVVLLSSYIVGNQTAGTPPFVARSASGNLNPGTGATVDIFDLVILQAFIVGNYATLPI